MEKRVCVFGVILGDFNQVLLYKNPEERKEFPDEEPFMKKEGWGRPGGVKRPDEDEVDALIREVKEETGFQAWVKEETRYKVDRGTHFDVTYLCEIIGGKQKGRCGWWQLNVLPRKIYPFHRDIILLFSRKYRKRN